VSHRQGDRSDRRATPLYEPRFEHDACGVGFVADAGGRGRDRVLPLALAGLAALGHRGAFGADGESSDGAGVALPLDRSVLGLLVGEGAAARPGIVSLFLRRGRAAERDGRALVERVLAETGLDVVGWRAVPVDIAALGASAATSRPTFAQAIVARPGRTASDPRPVSDAAFERRLVVARRRLETAARAAGGRMAELSVPSASARTIVYKGLVTGARLADLYPDLRAPLTVGYAVFHQRYATNTHPVWRLAQPFRSIAHNGEINTVRGNREQIRGRTGDGTTAAIARQLLDAGPLLSADGSDSLSLDEAVELLTTTGWELTPALLTAIPEALALRRAPHPHVASLRRRTAGFLAPWDGPAAIVFADGRRVGALVDRNGLRPAAFAVTHDRLVAVASEAGAVPFTPAETVRRGRLGPGELLLVEPGRRSILEDTDAKAAALRSLAIHDAARPVVEDRIDGAVAGAGGDDTRPRPATDHVLRYLAGLDAERARLDIKTMALEGHEPLWSMGDDTPTPGRARLDRPVADHLRQAFAQVTNPAIDPERERIVMDLRVELGRRPALLGGPPREPRTVRIGRPFVVDLDGLLEAVRGAHARSRRGGAARIAGLDATWEAAAGTAGLADALDRLATEAVRASRRGAEVLVLTDASATTDRIVVPSILATGAVHTALTDAGHRGRTDIVVSAADVLDVHAMAMLLAVGATVVHPRLAIELAAELAGTRGAEALTPADTVANLVAAFEAGLRKTLARMGISAVASYIGGSLIDVVDLDPAVVGRCFPTAAAWPGGTTFEDLAGRQLRRRTAALALPEPLPGREPRLPDPGFARFRADGEAHLFSPRIATEIETLAGVGEPRLAEVGEASTPPVDIETALARYRAGLARPAAGRAVPRDDLRVRTTRTQVPLADVENARSIVRRFVVSAMSVGALSPEAHQALTIGIQRAGGAANTGEGGEDPAWYRPGPDGKPHDARIKQVASARFGVTATYLARADQLEIKIAQGSKPGEGGQLPGRKATAYIAALRRGQPGQSYISPPPHHDIYSIEDLAQLIADLGAINPAARIGVKLVAGRGVGTIAAGVAKAGASYIHLSGHAGGTGASPLSSIKHVGAPWELGLAEVHQVLLRNDLRDRVALRTDGGLQTGRDLLFAALLGAEEFAFGTAALVAIGCDMARQCHLDTCPTGIATQREDLRAKFAGRPEDVARFFTAIAEDLRRELASVGARTVGEIVGESRRLLRPATQARAELGPVVGARRWGATPARRGDPAAAGREVPQEPASALEAGIASAFRGQGPVTAGGLRLTTADRSFGAALTGALERGQFRGPVRLELCGVAGQSFGAFASPGVELRLVGQANDYVAKGLSGGTVVVAPEPDLGADAAAQAIAGNTVLYGATAGRLHLVGRAGMRFAVRNSGADAVVEGIGAHGCEYMTGGTVVVLGPVGANFGAGMTGGRAFLYDPSGRHMAALDERSVRATRLAAVVAARDDGRQRLDELVALLADHRAAGSRLAARLLEATDLAADTWLVEPVDPTAVSIAATGPAIAAEAASQPDRNPAVPGPLPTPVARGGTVESAWGSVTSG
jgi:glutamate synthase domain-containing protein 2/glutamate synthase domain-containing protein 1/glutamate synthase domain-containing protein 3